MTDWISVKDRLPEEMLDVFVYNAYSHTIYSDRLIHNFLTKTKELEFGVTASHKMVTHWMIMPEPPPIECCKSCGKPLEDMPDE